MKCYIHQSGLRDIPDIKSSQSLVQEMTFSICFFSPSTASKSRRYAVVLRSKLLWVKLVLVVREDSIKQHFLTVPFGFARLTMENLKLAWKVADQTDLQELEDACLNYMHAHFTNFLESPLLTGMKFGPLLNLFKREICVPNAEEVKFDAIASWVEADKSGKRYQHLTDVLETISKAHLSQTFIVKQLAALTPATNHPCAK